MITKFGIGATVYHAQTQWREFSQGCPSCFGKKKLTIIMGDGTQHEIDCVECQVGYDPPRGYVMTRDNSTDVMERQVCEVTESNDGFEYLLDNHYVGRQDTVFATREEAEAKAQEMCKERDEEERQKMARKERPEHSWAWNVSYHRRCIRDARKTLAYHEAKLGIAQTKAKPEKETPK
jgi:hypothetical protein